MNDERWEEEMRRKLCSYEEPAPDALWQELDKALAKRRTVALWRRSLAAAAALALLAGAGWIYFSRFNNIEHPHNLAVKTLTGGAGGETTDGVDEPVAGYVAKSYVAKSRVRNVAAVGVGCAEVSSLPTDAQQQEAQTADETVETVAQTTAMDSGKGTQTTQKKRSLRELFGEESYEKKERRVRLTAKAYMGNSAMGYDNQGERTTMLAGAATYGNAESDALQDNGNGQVMAGTTPDETTVSHSQPIRYGLSLRYELDDRWSVETGLTYSYLRSEMQTVGSTQQTRTVQKLHYVGIPVTVSYSLWRNRKANVYLSAGATIEKMVSGRAEEKTYGNDGNEKTDSRKLTIDRPQFSVGCSVGAEYMFSSSFGVYAEPGASYYFDNHSDIPTIYSDKPLNLSLNIGLRMNFFK